MQIKSLIKLLAVLISLPIITAAQEKYSVDYKIGPRDVLEISVFGREELNKTVRVSEDGKITLPLLGEIEVENLTKSELEQKISRLLEERYLQNPQVSIFIKEYLSRTVSVLGAVKNPGSYELIGKQTLLEIISKAGSFTGAEGDEIIIIRHLADGSSSSLSISKNDLLNGDTRLNVILQSNDIVNVKIDETVNIYVFGQVKNPGVILVKKSKIPSLLQAIIQAGGFSDRASKGSVLLKRIDENGQEQKIKVNVKDIINGKKKDIPLREGDIIYIPETIF